MATTPTSTACAPDLTSILPKVAGKWPRRAVVLGAGGGARAVVAVLIGSGFQRVAVFNRHLHKAEAVVAHFARSARHLELRAVPWHETFLEVELAKAKLLVNASGIGVEEGTSPVPAALLGTGLFVLDLVLEPRNDAAHAGGAGAGRDRRERPGVVPGGLGRYVSAVDGTGGARRGAAGRALAAELGLPEEGIAVVGD